MHIINLDPKFQPFGSGMSVDQFTFPSGFEGHIKIKSPELIRDKVLITCRIKTSHDLFMLLLATDAVRRAGAKLIQLVIPYLPYARQDRVMVPGEPLSLKVICDILNAQSYDKVILYDVHSDTTLALLDRSVSITNHSLVSAIVGDKKDFIVVSPDAGAYKKIFKVCEYIGYNEEIIICNKTRDVKTGHILNTTVGAEDLGGKDVFIIDDICDGGGTFILLGEALRKKNVGKINLIVSHGIFTKGIRAVLSTIAHSKPVIDHIYTTDSIRSLDNINDEFVMRNERYLDKVTQIKLSNLLPIEFINF
jgi:ribose-phosphate pyrophosphokinase